MQNQLKTTALLATLGLAASFNSVLGAPGLTLNFYENIPNTDIGSLRADPDFPANPDSTINVLTAEAPTNRAENFGGYLFGYIIPTTSGVYDFYISADDNAEFYVSTDSSPANIQQIAREPSWNGERQYATSDRRTAGAEENRSTTLFPNGLSLQAGQAYYVEGLYKEGGGGDNFSFAADLRDSPGTVDAIPTVPVGAAGDTSGLALDTVPEPASAIVALAGGLALVLRRRRTS